MHILVTRPEADAREMKAQIEALGHRVSIAPLIEIVLKPVEPDALRGAAGLIATSRNGVAALRQSPAISGARSLPIFTVGPATAEAARRAGFITVLEGAGTARDLAPLIANHAVSKAGPFVHLAGDHLAVDLPALLRDAGVDVRPVVAYCSIAARSLPDVVAAALADGDLDAVILMSPRTARTWAELAAQMLDRRGSSVVHLCLSQAVAEGLPGEFRQTVHVAHSPSSDGILSLIQRLAPQGRTS